METISLKSIIAPHFWKTFNSRKPHQIYKGGRGSTKTSMIALKIVFNCLSEDKCSVVVLRKHQNQLRKSVFREIKRACGRLGLIEKVDYVATTSPMEIKFLNKKNTVYFAGGDDFETVKGTIDEDNPIKIVWFEELTGWDNQEDIDQIVATFTRGNDNWFMALYSYNPPKNKFEWINEWAEKMAEDENNLVSESDYRSVPDKWLGPMFIQEAERMKKYDLRRYEWIYLGKVIGMEGLIFNYDLINVVSDSYIEEEELKCVYLDFAMDVGYSTSATTCICIGYMNDGEWYLLDTYYSSPKDNVKKSPSELADDIFKFRIAMQKKWMAQVDKETCDSAETALPLELYKKYGIQIHKVNKGSNKEEQCDFASDFLSQCKFNVIDNNNNKIFLKEIKNYKWKQDSVEKGKPEPDKTEKELLNGEVYFNTHSNLASYYYCDHSVDAFIYWVLDNKQKLNIKQ